MEKYLHITKYKGLISKINTNNPIKNEKMNTFPQRRQLASRDMKNKRTHYYEGKGNQNDNETSPILMRMA